MAGPAGCGSDRATRGEGTIDVVATVAPLADIVHNAGGARVIVSALVPAAADAHAWRPGPAERAALREADLVVWTGGAIDRWAADAGGERELGLLPQVDPLGDDPHWWQDPVRVQRAAKEIRNELARADVDGAGYYEAATADFLDRLRRLHRDMRICMSLRRPAAARASRRSTPASRTSTTATARRSSARADEDARVGRRLWADALGEPGTLRRLLPRRDGREHGHDRRCAISGGDRPAARAVRLESAPGCASRTCSSHTRRTCS